MPDPPAIYTGLGEVVASGTVIAFDASSAITVHIRQPPHPLSVVFNFEPDVPTLGPGLQPTVEIVSSTTDTVTLLLRNFGGTSGSGNNSPLKLGVLDGLALYLNFRVSEIRAGLPKTLTFTFYKRDDARVAKIQREGMLAFLDRDE